MFKQNSINSIYFLYINYFFIVYCFINTINNKLYIGETVRSDFNERFNQHKMAIDDINNNLPIYKILRIAKKMNRNIYLKPLIDLSVLKVEHHNCEFSNKEIECMEMALIIMLKPKCNVEGIYKPYRFS